jgi:hypothetical protein
MAIGPHEDHEKPEDEYRGDAAQGTGGFRQLADQEKEDEETGRLNGQQ